MARVAALVPDLLFGSKVAAMIEAAGHEPDLFGQEHEAWERAPGAALLVVDLASEEVDGATLVDSMRTGGELHGTRTLGFYAHVDAATKARAEEVGFDLVVPRSRMAREGSDLIGRLAAQA